MTRSALSRCLASILALVAGLAVPGAALVHGYAHHAEAHQHDADAERDLAGHEIPATPVVSSPAGGDDHPHPQIARAIATRPAMPHVAPVVPYSSPAIDFPVVERPRIIVAAALPRADPGFAPSLHSRAPPRR